MRYLLDTHTLLWSIGGSQFLSRKAKAILNDGANEVFVSAVSLWEIALKQGLGKLKLDPYKPEDIPHYMNLFGYTAMPLSPEEALAYRSLPKNPDHKDPFDRMLITQCIKQGLIFMSGDSQMKYYKKAGLQHVW